MTSDVIDKTITQVSAGNYALGYTKDGIFIVKYVGRSDSDVASRLKEHLQEGYKQFKFCYASSPRDAFLRECQNYHDFGESKELDNKIHPDKPENADWKCPVCKK